MAKVSLPALLKRLRDAGVSEAAFHPDGKLAAVTFAGALPPASAEPGDEGKRLPAHITAAQRAFQVLNGQRESMDDEKATA